jgi:hypothetical protein
MEGMIRTRLVAVAAALTVTIGAVAMLVALVAAPGSWLAGYVSEAGTAGMPYAIPYRAGLIILALGVALLGSAVRVPALFAAAGLAGISGAVPCSNQCPLPPYEPTTLADVIHAGATILGLLTLAAAMALLWYADERPLVRRLSAYSATVIIPLGAVLGLTMVFVGRGGLGAALERLTLVVAVTWLVGVAVIVALPETHRSVHSRAERRRHR